MPINKLEGKIINPGKDFAKLSVESMDILVKKLNELITSFNSLEERVGKVENEMSNKVSYHPQGTSDVITQ